MTKTFSPAIEELAEWTHDVVRSRRAQWRANNARATLELVAQKGPKAPEDIKEIPPRLQSRILDKIADEDDENVRTLWVNLLCNAIDKNSGYDLKKLHLRVLEEIDPAEVSIIESIRTFLENRPIDVQVLPGKDLAIATSIQDADLDPYMDHLTSLGCFSSSDKSVGLLVEGDPDPSPYVQGSLRDYSISPLLKSLILAISRA